MKQTIRSIQSLFFLLLLFFICNNIFAQSKLGFGLIFGSNSPTIKTEDSFFQPKSQSGLVAGVSCQIRLMGSFYLQTGLQFLHKKANFTYPIRPNGFSSPSIDETTYWQYNYMEFPVLFKYKYSFKKYSPYIFIGPNFGLINSYEVITKRGSQTIKKNKNDLILAGLFSNERILDISLDLGAGVEYHLKEKITIFIYSQYLFGLSSIYKYSTWKWRNIRVTTGLYYNL